METEKKDGFILQGNICYTEDPDSLTTVESGYLVCENGRCAGVFPEFPAQYSGLPVTYFGDKIIIPGLVDLHLHAPQYPIRGTGMDLELLEWLNEHAFPEEMKYADPAYAEEMYGAFARDLRESATTRACIFATVHREAAEVLMDRMEETGLVSFVGKVSMDRNAPEELLETTEDAVSEVEKWLSDLEEKYTRTCPVLTPRFVPSCSNKLLKALGEISGRQHIPVQSHLSENRSEISWVEELCPWSEFYGDVYDYFGLFGSNGKAVMAHCVWSGRMEIDRMRERDVFVAHCPESNMNLSSGIAPVRDFLDSGIHVGLGTDIAAGSSLSLFRAMAQAVQVSKLRYRLVDHSLRPLTVSEAFYMATKGGGAFFGKVGSFEEDYEFDAVVLDDTGVNGSQGLSVAERLERIVYLEDQPDISAKYVGGRRLF
ncbi:MAG: amidohydrolase family protein [Bacteroidales bacterium]|nr:amidohydrolase family protein [Bacteroidales bacterium]